MCVAFAVFFEAINMAPFSFEGVDGLFEFTHPKFEAFKQTRNSVLRNCPEMFPKSLKYGHYKFQQNFSYFSQS